MLVSDCASKFEVQIKLVTIHTPASVTVVAVQKYLQIIMFHYCQRFHVKLQLQTQDLTNVRMFY